MDYHAAPGTPIMAANSGEVILAHELFYEGNCVIINHGQQFMTIYMHMSRLDVKEGDRCTRVSRSDCRARPAESPVRICTLPSAGKMPISIRRSYGRCHCLICNRLANPRLAHTSGSLVLNQLGYFWKLTLRACLRRAAPLWGRSPEFSFRSSAPSSCGPDG